MELLNCANAGAVVASESSKAKQRALQDEKTIWNEQHALACRIIVLILTVSEYSRL
jgi:hypothetical protein